MWIIAQAPPVPVGAKLTTALLMVALVVVLLVARRGEPLPWFAVAHAVAASIGLVLLLEVFLRDSHGSLFHDRGVIAAIVGASSAALFLWLDRPGPPRRRVSRFVPLVALVGGPLVGLLCCTPFVLLGHVSPLDLSNTLGVFIMVGALAGMIGACIVGVAVSAESPQSATILKGIDPPAGNE